MQIFNILPFDKKKSFGILLKDMRNAIYNTNAKITCKYNAT